MRLTLGSRPVLPAFIAFLLLSSALHAHRLDEYLQATIVSIEPGNIRLLINLTPGVAAAEQVLGRIDVDRDGEISIQESTAYAESLKRDLIVRLDERNVDLKLAASHFPEAAELRSGFGIIQMEFSFDPKSLAVGGHTLTLENRHLTAVSVYLINAAKPTADTVQITRQKRNEHQSTGEIEFSYHPTAVASER